MSEGAKDKDITPTNMHIHLGYLIEDVKEIKESCVSKAEFEPIKRIVYGVVALIGMAVVGAVMSGLFKG